MKIGIINLNTKNNIYTNPITSNKQYQQNLHTVSDTISFSSKIPSIVTPTMEDLIKRTKAVDVLRFNILRLAKYGIPCPVCGHIMLDVNKFNEFEEKVMATTNTGKLLGYIEELQEYLHPVERKMFKMMKDMHLTNHNMTIHEMLKRRLSQSEKRIIQEQSKIFINLSNFSKKLPIKRGQQVQALINETYARILDPRETSRFSRKIFITKLKEALGIMPQQIKNKDGEIIAELKAQYTPLQQIIMEEAVKLPMAYNNEDAFIVKYAKRNYNQANPDQKIVLRMLSNSLATIEHIKAQKLKGDTAPPNLSLECACCNNAKNHNTVFEQIVENPRMILNYPRYMRRLCEIHLMGKVEKSYITQQNKTFKKESLGLLDSSLSLIRYPYLKRGKYAVKDSSKSIIEEKKKKSAKSIKSKHAKKLERSKNNKSQKYCRRR